MLGIGVAAVAAGRSGEVAAALDRGSLRRDGRPRGRLRRHGQPVTGSRDRQRDRQADRLTAGPFRGSRRGRRYSH